MYPGGVEIYGARDWSIRLFRLVLWVLLWAVLIAAPALLDWSIILLCPVGRVIRRMGIRRLSRRPKKRLFSRVLDAPSFRPLSLAFARNRCYSLDQGMEQMSC
jgi:hypothetical protein